MIIIDKLTAEFLASDNPEPKADDMAILTANVVQVSVFDGGMAAGRPIGTQLLFATSEQAAIEQLVSKLALAADPPSGHCMCFGDPTVLLTKEDGSQIAIGLHHGFAIRIACWKSDARLADGRGLLEFLDSCGVRRPLTTYLDALRRDQEAELAASAWRAAVPPRLAGQQEGVHPLDGDIRSLYVDFVETAPDKVAALRELLAWYGSGTGLYSGYPSYESVPEDMLCMAPLTDLVKALEASLSRAEMCGAARLLKSWSFRSIKSKVPLRLRAKFLLHSTAIR